MSLKTELQEKLSEIGYHLGPFASKDTLSVVLCLHSVVMAEKNVNVARLSDVDLRRQLIQHGRRVGPVTNHTRAIYQRKLLEVLTNRTTEGQDDQSESDESVPSIGYEKNSLYPNLFETEQPLSRRRKEEPAVLRNNYKPTRTTVEESNDRRSRLPSKPLTVKQGDVEKPSVATKNSGGTFLYVGIALLVALLVFVGYFWFEN